jgi:hypothetical protein
MHTSKLSKDNCIEPEFEERRRKGTKQVKMGFEPKETPENMNRDKIAKPLNADDRKEAQV